MFKKGEQARLLSNPLDEQLGESIATGVKTITDTKDVTHIKGTSGQWVKIAEHNDWIDSAYFESVLPKLDAIHNSTATDSGKGYNHFGIHKSTARLYGDKPEDIVEVAMTISEDQTLPPEPQDDPKVNEPDYWGWWSFTQERFTMVYAKRFLLSMCFPAGIKGAEEYGEGKAYRLIVKPR